MPMSPREVANAWFEYVWNRKDASAIDRYLAPEAKMHGLGAAPMTLADFKQMHATFCAAFPDIRIEVVRTVSEGDMVVALCQSPARTAARPLAARRRRSASKCGAWAWRASPATRSSRAGTHGTSCRSISR